MTTNSTDVWNRALIKLNVRTVASITADDSKEAKIGNLLYQDTLDFLLREHFWGFARKEAALALVTGATSVQYDYIYAQPADCLKIRNVYRALSKSDPIPYEKRTGATETTVEIMTDEEDAVMVYTASIVNVPIMDKGFVDALVFLLARDSAMTLTGSLQLYQSMETGYILALSKAMKSDDQELIDKTNPIPPAETARTSGI